MIDGFDAAQAGDTDALNVKASDDGKTLTIVLAYPCSYFDKMAAFAAMSPVQQATVEANGDSWCTSAETFVSNGPYMITDWTPVRAHRADQEPQLRWRLGQLQDRL